jgi:uncharacterized membrane protein
MKKRIFDTKYMVTLAMLCAILVDMGMTGIGFIPLPVIKATTMHIPVIIGAIILGPIGGALLGAVFGLCSIWANTTAPGILSFAFSPFMTNEGIAGIFKSLWIALGCRVAFGYLAGWIWKTCKKVFKKDVVALPVSASLATITHTLLVMWSIYLLLAQQYAQAKNVGYSAVFGLIMGTVTASGIPEAIAAAILVTLIGIALFKIINRTPSHKRGY